MARGNTANAYQRLAKAEESRDAWQGKANALETALASTKAETEALAKDKDNLQQELATLTTRHSRAEVLIRELQTERDELAASLALARAPQDHVEAATPAGVRAEGTVNLVFVLRLLSSQHAAHGLIGLSEYHLFVSGRLTYTVSVV